MPEITTTTSALPPATHTPACHTPAPCPLPPVAAPLHITSHRWGIYIKCSTGLASFCALGARPKKYATPGHSRVSLALPLLLSHSLPLFLCLCAWLFLILHKCTAGFALSLSPARQPVIDCRPQCLLQVAPLDSTPSASPFLLSVASCSGATAAAAAATAAVADVNLLKKFRFLAFFCILADGLSLYCAGGNRFHFMLSIEFKLFGK